MELQQGGREQLLAISNALEHSIGRARAGIRARGSAAGGQSARGVAAKVRNLTTRRRDESTTIGLECGCATIRSLAPLSSKPK